MPSASSARAAVLQHPIHSVTQRLKSAGEAVDLMELPEALPLLLLLLPPLLLLPLAGPAASTGVTQNTTCRRC